MRSASRRAPSQIVPGGPAFLHPGRSATLQFGPKNIVGWFGELHPSACEALDVEGPIVAFEIVLDAVAARRRQRPTKAQAEADALRVHAGRARSRLPRARGDAAGDILKAALAADRALIAKVNVFDVYRGAGVPEG